MEKVEAETEITSFHLTRKRTMEKAAIMSLLLLEKGFSNLAKLSQRVSLKDEHLVAKQLAAPPFRLDLELK